MGSGTVRVLQSVRSPGPRTNPYVVQLVRALRAEVPVQYFSWRRGLLGRYDLLHVHWPEVLLRRAGRAARLAARVRFALLMLRVTLLRTPVVRTVHNVAAHEPADRLEQLLVRWCERRTSFWILLTSTTPLPRPGPSRVIPHGDYARWFAGHAVPPPTPGRLACIGLLRPYKGTEVLLAAFRALADPAATLRVVGQPSTEQLARSVLAGCRQDERISALLAYVDDATLAAEVGAAQLVVLPHPDLHSSGTLLLALSLHRPALVPRTPATLELAAEVGPGWVLTYDGELGPDDLAAALAASCGPPAAPPELTRRDWSVVTQQHLEVYRSVLAGTRAGHRG